jgi:hypothetical protein
MTRVSSLSSAPDKVDSPVASAAQTSARFVILFDPGGRMRPWIGPLGVISIERFTNRPSLEFAVTWNPIPFDYQSQGASPRLTQVGKRRKTGG